MDGEYQHHSTAKGSGGVRNTSRFRTLGGALNTEPHSLDWSSVSEFCHLLLTTICFKTSHCSKRGQNWVLTEKFCTERKLFLGQRKWQRLETWPYTPRNLGGINRQIPETYLWPSVTFLEMQFADPWRDRSIRLADINSPEEYNLQSKGVILWPVNSAQVTAIWKPEQEL